MSSKKKRNTSSRAAKVQRQAKAHAARSTRPTSPEIAAFPATLEALKQALAVGHLPMLCSDGQVRQLTYDQMRDHLNASFTADGEPPLSPGELARFLANDLTSGEMAMRTDGVWVTSEDYFAMPEVQP
ncbi:MULTISPECIES: hypothetical protein [unclassified Streptomyces]|uniref:hypothetical protein n=1 Tax=unclassified Streptomyces TaxID=2593676 RepID=UPI000805D06D|nr:MULTISPECIES: hypothetical protein [unclassified Streptomyces]MYR75133.1 hypothetical protein [Streptomyces sp. SID4925]SBU98014.1 hypothetical protein YUMDRAFT_06003 [Streptomyces sp. OspMP-M45]